ncbi:MAG: MgtC/SapB family protein [Acholeplasmataceae bacterium]|jgi:putative Mg2+ transporter-C (MgtC) family protein
MLFLSAVLDRQLPELVGLVTFEDYFFKIILPLILTFLFSGFIGLERQNMGKAAGISAHILVAISSATLAIMQRLMMLYELSLTPAAFQGQRVIAQVVTGIGFIGAGVIMKDKFTVKGLTTAATIWTTAMIGLVLGSGYLIVGTALGLIVCIFILLRDLNRGINPFKPYRAPHHAVKRYRFLSKSDQDDVIAEEFHQDEDFPHL